ncbi:MAG: NAD(P)/FAD-dependent oxidoreductase, partial [Anaerolineales bacterium]|nr:NAD(P)/FAD-dependent oxidoreductase [Anaerolineales bacterium]
MPAIKKKYDVAIIGSGMGGSTLAAILARQGLAVIVFEGGQHPKFAIGESTILETAEMMRALAEFYDVPELAYFSSENYLDYAGTTHGVKRHFGFVHHDIGKEPTPARTLQAIIPKEPYGHELHIYRQDSDSFLTSVAISYGATILQNTPVADVEINAAGVEIATAKDEKYRAAYIVDAGGFRSLLAKKFDLRDDNLQTNTRGIFTHMVDVPCFHEVYFSKEENGVPFRWSEGTLHHLFEGGWLWVIPFNNHPDATNPVTSVGLLLDPRIHPPHADLTPEEEFYGFIEQYPGIRKQFTNAKPIRGWVRSERLQYSSKRVVGNRFALMGHAVGFIDPIYSKGLYVTHITLMLLADLLIRAKKTGDYSEKAFAPLEAMTFNYLKMHDRLAANSIKSWSNYKLWQVYSVQWLLGAYLEYLMLSVARMRAKNRADYIDLLKNNRLAGGGFEGFFELQEKVDTLFEQVNPEDEIDVNRMVAKANTLFRAFKWLPLPFTAILDG